MTLRVTTYDENVDPHRGSTLPPGFAIIRLPGEARCVTGAFKPVTESDAWASRGTTHCCHRARRADSSSDRCPPGTLNPASATRCGHRSTHLQSAQGSGVVCPQLQRTGLYHTFYFQSRHSLRAQLLSLSCVSVSLWLIQLAHV